MRTSFPVEGLLWRENFISLLYYLGLLSFAGEREGAPLLRIPNQTVQHLMYSYLRVCAKRIAMPRYFDPIPWN